MSVRFQNNNQVLNNTLSQFDSFYQPIGKKTNVYKFRKVSGSVYMTKYGELPLNVKSENFQQNFQIYTGKEPITVYWENSTRLEVKDNKIIQTIQVGDYETCYLQESGVQIDKELVQKNLFGKEYTTTFLKYTINLQTNKWIPTEDDIRDYFYIILDEKSKCIKWLEIVNVSPVYNEETNKIQYVEITFETINDKYTSSGKSILDFVQMGAIGEGYTWPKETYLSNGDIKVELDYKHFEGIKESNSLQIDFTTGAALSSLLVFGRRKSKKIDNNTYEVQPSQLLFVYDLKNPIPSKFFFNKPNSNVYVGSKIQPTKEGVWKSYKDSFKGNDRIGEYNILNTKEVLTGLSHDPVAIKNSNPNINTHTLASTNKFLVNFGKIFDYDYNPYCFSDKKGETSVYLKYNDILNIAAMQNFYSDVFEYDYKETKKWKLTDTLGILGFVMNFIVGGLDIGWTTSNKLADVPNNMTLLIPCISYEDGMLALDANAPIPLDIFFDDKAQKVLPTSTNVYSSYRFSFTDMIKDTSQVKIGKPIGQGGGGIWNTKYLGQTKYEDGTDININGTPFRFNVATTTAYVPSNVDDGFVIDYIDFKAIASCDYKLTGFDKYNQSNYYFIGETNGKASGDIRVWGNATKFNYWNENNTSGELDYPQNVKPIYPADVSIPVDMSGFGIGYQLKNICGANITYTTIKNAGEYVATYELSQRQYFDLSAFNENIYKLWTMNRDNNNFPIKFSYISFNNIISNWKSTEPNTINSIQNQVLNDKIDDLKIFDFTKSNGESIKDIKQIKLEFYDGEVAILDIIDNQALYKKTLNGRFETIAGGYSAADKQTQSTINKYSIKELDTERTFDIKYSYEPLSSVLVFNFVNGVSGNNDHCLLSVNNTYQNISIEKIYTDNPYKLDNGGTIGNCMVFKGNDNRWGNFTEMGTGRNVWVGNQFVAEATKITDTRLQIKNISFLLYN